MANAWREGEYRAYFRGMDGDVECWSTSVELNLSPFEEYIILNEDDEQLAEFLWSVADVNKPPRFPDPTGLGLYVFLWGTSTFVVGYDLTEGKLIRA